MKAVICLLQTKWHELKNQSSKKYLLLSVFFLLLSFLIALFFTSLQKDVHLSKDMLKIERAREIAVMDQISSLRTQINQLGLSTQNSTQVSKMNNELASIEKDVTGVAKSDELQKMAVDMKNRLDDLEKIVTESAHAKKYVDAKVLPFQVISVDMMSGQPFVSVNYKNQVTPLGIGDSLASWKIIDTDYENVSVELVNNQGQYVKINVPENVALAGIKE